MKNTKMGLLVLLIMLLIYSTAVNAATKKQVRFLGLGEASCRAIGMGEAFVAVSDDASAVFWNPAGLAQIPSGKRYGDFMIKANLRNETTYDSLAFSGQSYEDDNNVDFTIGDYLQNRMKAPKAERKVNYNYAFGIIGINGEDNYQNTNIMFAAAKAFNTSFDKKQSKLAGGIKFRYSDYSNYMDNNNQLESFHESSIGFGALYSYSDFLNIGLTIDNAFKNSIYDIPTIVSIGFAFKIDPTTTVDADGFNLVDSKSLNNSNQNNTEFRIGVEKSFLNDDLTLRFGSKNGNLNLGFDMKVTENFDISYAYMGDYNSNVNQHFVGGRVTF
jgi:hypothetical protein